MIVTSDLAAPSFCDGFNTHHIGTLQCREEGASTPSTKPVSRFVDPFLQEISLTVAQDAGETSDQEAHSTFARRRLIGSLSCLHSHHFRKQAHDLGQVWHVRVGLVDRDFHCLHVGQG